MKIVVHVERLVLDGLGDEPGHARRIGAAVERELGRLFAAAPHHVPAGGAVPRVAAPEMRPVRGDTPETTGARIAAAVHAGMTVRGTR